jgi:hypothetical protein
MHTTIHTDIMLQLSLSQLGIHTLHFETQNNTVDAWLFITSNTIAAVI